MFATWRWTVCGLRISCSAISRSLSPLRDEPQHLAFASRQQRGRRLCFGRALGRALRRQYRAHRPDHAVGIAGPREVGAPLQRDERRARDPRGDLATEPVRDRAVLAPVDDQRGGLHQRQLVANVIAIDLLEQPAAVSALAAKR